MWKNNLTNGIGRMVSDGQIQEGMFENGVYMYSMN